MHRSLTLVALLTALAAVGAEPTSGKSKVPPAAAQLPKAPRLTPELAAAVAAMERGEVPELPPPFRWDVPGAVEQIEIPGTQVALGIPMRLHAVRSTWRVEALYDHFMKSFLDAKLYVPPHSDINMPLRDPNLTGLDPFRQLSYTVILQVNPDRTVTCIMGEANLGQREKQKVPFAPLHPTGKEPFVATVEGLRSLSYLASAQPSDILRFYSEELPRAGFQEIEPQKFRKGNVLWWIRAERDGPATRVMVVDSGALPSSK